MIRSSYLCWPWHLYNELMHWLVWYLTAVFLKKIAFDFVGSAWSFGFFIPATTPMTSDFVELISIPDCIHYILFYLISVKKGISLFNFQCQTRELLAPLLYRLWYDAVLDWGLNPGHPSLFWFRFWRYLTRELTWHLSQSYGPQLILVPLWNHTRIRAWNQPTMSNEGKVYCSKDLMDDVMYCYVR